MKHRDSAPIATQLTRLLRGNLFLTTGNQHDRRLVLALPL